MLRARHGATCIINPPCETCRHGHVVRMMCRLGCNVRCYSAVLTEPRLAHGMQHVAFSILNQKLMTDTLTVAKTRSNSATGLSTLVLVRMLWLHGSRQPPFPRHCPPTQHRLPQGATADPSLHINHHLESVHTAQQPRALMLWQGSSRDVPLPAAIAGAALAAALGAASTWVLLRHAAECTDAPPQPCSPSCPARSPAPRRRLFASPPKAARSTAADSTAAHSRAGDSRIADSREGDSRGASATAQCSHGTPSRRADPYTPAPRSGWVQGQAADGPCVAFLCTSIMQCMHIAMYSPRS